MSSQAGIDQSPSTSPLHPDSHCEPAGRPAAARPGPHWYSNTHTHTHTHCFWYGSILTTKYLNEHETNSSATQSASRPLSRDGGVSSPPDGDEEYFELLVRFYELFLFLLNNLRRENEQL